MEWKRWDWCWIFVVLMQRNYGGCKREREIESVLLSGEERWVSADLYVRKKGKRNELESDRC